MLCHYYASCACDTEIPVLQLFADEQIQLKAKICPIKTVITEIYFTTNVVFYFKRPFKNGGQWRNLVTIFGFSNVKSIRPPMYYRDEI
jgi:nicotinamide mononucleotide adenylyltransferase